MPDHSWELAILLSINSLDGEASLQEIYRKLPSFRQFTENEWRETQWGGRPAFQHQVRSHITNLCDAGCLERIGRGQYLLTQAGRRKIA